MKEQRVLIRLLSEIADEEDTAQAERVSAELYGSLSAREGFCRLTYTEETEGGEVRTDMTVREGHIRMHRRGAVVSDMHFAEGLCHRSLYEIPPYRFDMTTETEALSSTLTEAGGELLLRYRNTVGGAPRRCCLRLSVTPVSAREDAKEAK